MLTGPKRHKSCIKISQLGIYGQLFAREVVFGLRVIGVINLAAKWGLTQQNKAGKQASRSAGPNCILESKINKRVR